LRFSAKAASSLKYSCSNIELETGKETERDPQSCFKDAFGTVAGFIGLDYATRTRLNLLKPTFSTPKSKQANLAGFTAPQRGDIFDRVAKPPPPK